jgi:hypothetical protein
VSSEEDLDFSWESSSVVGEEWEKTPIDINVTDLVKKMRDPQKGVKIKRRTYKLKAYYDCFIGKEAGKLGNLFSHNKCPQWTGWPVN